MPRMAWPVARSVSDVPGRTSRTMPATGASSGSGTSPVAIRQRPRHVKSSSPPSTVWRTPAGPEPPSRDQRAPGVGSAIDWIETSSSRASRSRSAIGAPTTTDSPASTSGRSPGRQREDRVDRRLDRAGGPGPAPRSVADGHSAHAGTAGPTAACQARELLAPAVGAVRAAGAARRAGPRGRRPNRRRRRSRRPGRGRRAGPCRGTGTPRRPRRPAPAGRGRDPPCDEVRDVGSVAVVHDEPAGRAAAAQAGRHDQRPERDEQVVEEVDEDRPTLGLVRDAPDRAEQAGVVERDLAGAGPPQEVGQGHRHERRRHRRPDAAARDDQVRRRVRRRRRSRPRGDRGPHARPRPGCRGRRPSHRPTARSAARASGRGPGAGPWRPSTTS